VKIDKPTMLPPCKVLPKVALLICISLGVGVCQILGGAAPSNLTATGRALTGLAGTTDNIDSINTALIAPGSGSISEVVAIANFSCLSYLLI
jgi:hypothetical protein